MVTASRIADKYERIMKANPGWKVKCIKATVRLEMFADVHVSKIKKAKAIVRKRVREAMHE